MEFRIAVTFTDSLARLAADEQKAIKMSAFDLQMNPANPGLSFHKLDKAKDKNFWSVRVNRDIRIIVHRSQDSLLLCYVDHHDKAYDWAERRKVEVHPKTGAAQIVQIRETVQQTFVPVYVERPVQETPAEPKLLFLNTPDDVLLGYGVPEEWLQDVKQATEESLFVLVDHLPAEAAEALLELATGGQPVIKHPSEQTPNPFEHPDALRRFRTMHNVEELERALDFPWDRWTVFLHPEQKDIVSKTFSGPAKVSGSAGTGKTIVAVHRAVFLARQNPSSRVLLTTFSPTLANLLKGLLKKLVSNEPRVLDQIEVEALDQLGERLYRANIGSIAIATKDQIKQIISRVVEIMPPMPFSEAFLNAEWDQVVDTWNLQTWEDYRNVKRLGRKTRLPEQQRQLLWSVFENINRVLVEQDVITYSSLFHELARFVQQQGRRPYDFVVVDEAQDISIAQMRFLAALANSNGNGLFLAGDTGQRIFQQPFSWKSLGVDIRGRSKTLNVNYRTSHQIRRQADRLLGPEISDFDGNVEERGKTISVFNGPQPTTRSFVNQKEEIAAVAQWIEQQLQNNVSLHEIAVFVRSKAEIPRAKSVVELLNVPFSILDEIMSGQNGSMVVSTMHYAKGLEFKSVVVMACDDEIIPLQQRVTDITDPADLEEVYRTERHLLYVACTRARDFLLITNVRPPSEFLEDMLVSV